MQWILSAADTICKQFVPRARPTECRSWPGYKQFDTTLCPHFDEKVSKFVCLHSLHILVPNTDIVIRIFRGDLPRRPDLGTNCLQRLSADDTSRERVKFSICLCDRSMSRPVPVHARIQKILSEGVQLWQRFFSWWGLGGSKYHYKRAIIGPPAKRHLNGVSLACWWWSNIEFWLGSFVIFQGILTRIAKETLYFCE